MRTFQGRAQRLNLTEERKKRLREFRDNWMRSDTPVGIAEQALRFTKAKNREAFQFRDGDEEESVKSLVFTYGQGARPKMLLNRREAGFLLDVLMDLRRRVKGTRNQDNLATVLERATAVLLDDVRPPSTITDKSWEPVLDVLKEIHPLINQTSFA